MLHKSSIELLQLMGDCRRTFHEFSGTLLPFQEKKQQHKEQNQSKGETRDHSVVRACAVPGEESVGEGEGVL